MKADKLRIVCDTNVLVSMLGFPGGRLDTLWEIIQEEKVDLFLSEFILEELAGVLASKARLIPKEVEDVLRILRGRSTIVTPKTRLHVIQRKDSDNRILECAVDARAQVLLTGNFRDLLPLKSFRHIPILTPRDFLDKYFPVH
jgi:putative PIN family toxin of toxin-antitoxin system